MLSDCRGYLELSSVLLARITGTVFAGEKRTIQILLKEKRESQIDAGFRTDKAILQEFYFC